MGHEDAQRAGDRLREMGLKKSRLKKTRLQEHLKAPSRTKRVYKRAGEGLLKRACSDRKRVNGFKLRVSLDPILERNYFL